MSKRKPLPVIVPTRNDENNLQKRDTTPRVNMATKKQKTLLQRIAHIKAKQEKKTKPKREPGAWKGRACIDDLDLDCMETLLSAQSRVLREREKGTTCPCCGQFVKLYRRKLTSDMARFVCILSKYRPGRWVNIRKIDVRGGDYAKLVYWGLAEQRENADESKKDSGIWRLTERGYEFAARKTKVRSHAFVFNGKCEGMTGGKVSIKDALGEKFDYAELMGRK